MSEPLRKLAEILAGGWTPTIAAMVLLLVVTTIGKVHDARGRTRSWLTSVASWTWPSPIYIWGINSNYVLISQLSVSHLEAIRIRRAGFACVYALVFVIAGVAFLLTLLFGWNGVTRLRTGKLAWSFLLAVVAVLADFLFVMFMLMPEPPPFG